MNFKKFVVKPYVLLFCDIIKLEDFDIDNILIDNRKITGKCFDLGHVI